MRVYLSGGFYTNWQQKVIDFVPEAEFYNPYTFEFRGLTVGQVPVEIYGPMDRTQIELSDVVFAYMEASNPTPINVCFEVGYALGLGKVVVLCNEWTQDNLKDNNLRAKEFKDGEGNIWYKPHYFDLVNQSATFVESDFGRSMELLKMIVDAGRISQEG